MIIHSNNDTIFQLAGSPVLVNEAQMLRHDVYLQVGYIKEEYPGRVIPDEKDGLSDHLVALDHGEEMVGTIRLTPVDSKYDLFEHWKENLLPGAEERIAEICSGSARSVELGSLAVRKASSPRRVSWGLYKATFLYSLIQGIDYWVIGVDSRALRTIEMLGWSVERLGRPMDYVGSVSELGVMHVNCQLKAIFHKNPRYYSYVAGR